MFALRRVAKVRQLAFSFLVWRTVAAHQGVVTWHVAETQDALSRARLAEAGAISVIRRQQKETRASLIARWEGHLLAVAREAQSAAEADTRAYCSGA